MRDATGCVTVWFEIEYEVRRLARLARLAVLVIVLAVRVRERVSESLVIRDDRPAVTVGVVVGVKREVKVR